MGKFKIGKGPKSFKAMNAERADKRDSTSRFNAMTQSFNDRSDVQAAMRASRLKPAFDYSALPDPSTLVAERLAGAMRRVREGYQDDGSYVDRHGVRQSKAYLDNLQTNKPELEGKGEKGKLCNRTACQAPGAYWFNHSTRAFYCGTCADMINAVNTPDDSYVRDLGHPLLTIDPEFADKREERA